MIARGQQFAVVSFTTKATDNPIDLGPVSVPPRGGHFRLSSLHDAGFAIDINWSSLSSDQKKFALNRASEWGLKWGGGFKPYDPVHFYVDPFKTRQERVQAIKTAQKEFLEGR